MRKKPTLVQLMTCHLFGTKLLPEPMLAYCRLVTCIQIPMKLESKQFFFHENAIKNICKMTNILFHPLVPVPHNPLSSANIHRITIVSYPCPRIKAIYHSKRSINSLVFMNQVPTYLSRVPDQL